jgi:hypothetical protein
LPAAAGSVVCRNIMQLRFGQQLLQASYELAAKECTHDMDGK